MEPNSPSRQRSKRGKTTHFLTQIPHISTQYSDPDSLFIFPPLLPEILSEILSRLPVKSLSRFRCVSKAWRALISSSEFAKLHLNLSSSRKDFAHHKILSSFAGPQFSLKKCSIRSVISGPVTESIEVDYPMKSPHDSVWIVASCNGLICIAIEEKDLFIWNPTTGKFKKVPDSGAKLKSGFYFIYGFGYDELNDDYKVVGIFCFFHSATSCETQVMVYSLRNDSWRTIGDFKGGSLLNDAGKCVNGKIHWAVSPSFRVGSGWEIVSLDLAKEVYGKVEQPDYGEAKSDLTLGVVCGYLSVLCQYERSHMDLWVMKEYGVNESWTKMVTVPFLDDPRCKMFSYPICIAKNGEVILVLESEIAVYDPQIKALRFPEITNFHPILEAEIYVESLISPIADSEAGREQQQ